MKKLSECFTKLYRPPITTHSHFDLNESVSYPAITFCRDPPYKEEVLKVSLMDVSYLKRALIIDIFAIKAYNLSYHPKFSNAWRNFKFDAVDLNNLFQNATYGKNEFFGQYGLDGSPDSKFNFMFHFVM